MTYVPTDQRQWDFTTGLRVRLMSSAGVLISEWRPADRPREVRVTYDAVSEERETVSGGLYPVLRGYRARLRLGIEVVAGTVASTGAGTVALEEIVAGLAGNAGSYLDVALHYLGRLLGGGGAEVYDWKACNLEGGWSPTILGHDAAMRVELNFVARELQTTVPAYSSGSAW